MDLQNLTKKNQEFIHIATNQLIKDGKSDADIKAILEETLPLILEEQAKGVPARSFLGAPTSWASSFSQNSATAKPAANQAKNTNPWLMWLDTSLLFIGVVGLLNGLMAFFGSKAPGTGLISLLALGFGGGAAMYATYYFIYRHMGGDKKNRPSTLKIILALSLVMLAWVSIYYVSALLPQAINPVLPPLLLIILGALAFGLRYYLAKKYNVQNSLSPQR
ncbi:DUF1129 domain-containing protein [Streptococcus halichoeri]|uniref:DUF1129 domain-containing protein n=1 Tax=Streptococcus halichoeri TaxID=254785 RepID=UPI000DB096BD|nr:DUF1129 family protein [Streptococcus halichoeri]PZO96700.1 MAG: DUF1129 domain-containing protein [Streptococcus pyogenes]